MQDFILPVTIAGIQFKNPFYVASGPTARTVEQLLHIEKAGWGAASIKLSIAPKPYINRVPRYAVFKQYNALAFTAEKRLVFEQGLKLVSDAKKLLTDLIVMANITYAGDDGPDGWVHMAREFEAAGADTIEFNMCCPNMSFNAQVTAGDEEACSRKTGASLGKNAEIVSEIAVAVKKAIRIPLFVKLTPEGGEIAEVAQALYRVGVDAVGGTGNRLGIPPIDLENPGKAIYHLQDEISMSCYSGAWLKPLSQRDTYEIRKVCGPDVAVTATGGIRNAADALEMAMCGADLLGICSETLIRGYDFIGDVVAETRTWLHAHGHQQLRDVRDQIVPSIRSAPELTLYSGYAQVKEPALSAPCQAACPAGVPIQTLMKKVAERKYDEAETILQRVGPLQELCGTLCDAPCERACVKGKQTKNLQIRDIEKFLGKKIREKAWDGEAAGPIVHKQLGQMYVDKANLSGIMCAYDLLKLGYDVTIGPDKDDFHDCLPEHRLPMEILAFANAELDRLGIVRADETVRQEKETNRFDAIYHPATLIPGKCTVGEAMPALSLLLQGKNDKAAYSATAGTIAIIGNGILAAETARVLQSDGCKVTVITTAESPSQTLTELEAEKIPIIYGVTDFIWSNHLLTSTQRRSGAILSIPCDLVVNAIEAFDPSAAISDNGIWTDEVAQLSLSSARLIAAGKKAAQAIHLHLQNQSGSENATVAEKKAVVQAQAVLARSSYPVNETIFRLNRKQSQETLTEDQAASEASRCLRCGCGEGCDICRSICCEFAISLNEQYQMAVDSQKCVACGMCYNLCPNQNIEMINTGVKL